MPTLIAAEELEQVAMGRARHQTFGSWVLLCCLSDAVEKDYYTKEELLEENAIDLGWQILVSFYGLVDSH